MINVVRRYRVANGMNQVELAEATGYSQSFISQLESGKRRPNIDTFEVLAKVFKVSVSELLRGYETNEKAGADHGGTEFFETGNDFIRHDQRVMS